jgi:hypothetical protein
MNAIGYTRGPKSHQMESPNRSDSQPRGFRPMKQPAHWTPSQNAPGPSDRLFYFSPALLKKPAFGRCYRLCLSR